MPDKLRQVSAETFEGIGMWNGRCSTSPLCDLKLPLPCWFGRSAVVLGLFFLELLQQALEGSIRLSGGMSEPLMSKGMQADLFDGGGGGGLQCRDSGCVLPDS